MKDTAIVRESITDRVREILLARMRDGTYVAGARLIEMQIARELKVSQAPVREALRALETARMVETVAYRGTRVRGIEERERNEAYQVRAVLEELALQLGAKRMRERLGWLRSETGAMIAAAEAGEIARFLHHNARFHRAIIEAADNDVLRRTWDSLSFTVGARARGRRVSTNLVEVAREHRQIVETLARGQVKAAGRLLRRHSEARIHQGPQVTPPPASS